MNTSRGNGEPLADLEASLVEVEQVPKVEKIERRFNRKGQVVVILSLLVALCSLVWNSFNTVQIAQNEAQAAITQEGIESLKAANKQLEAKGLPQIPLPREGEPIDADALAAAAAAILYDQIEDDPRFRGPEGDQGDPGLPGEGGRTGDRGTDGEDGSEGQDGRNGRSVESLSIDSDGNLWVFFDDPLWPPMMVGHVVGPTGPKGDTGATGPQGPQGDPGPPCPQFYTPTRFTVVVAEGLTQEAMLCIPDEQ